MSDSTRPVTGFHARTDAEKLAKIAALDTFDVSVWGEPGSPFANGAAAMLNRVRAILAEPGPAVPAHDIDRDAGRYHDRLADEIIGFEVLAEPTPRVALYQEQQRVARAVLDRIASEPWAREIDLTKWRREFGVSS